MKYFKVFNTEEEYIEYISSQNAVKPNVSTLRDCSKTWINDKVRDYSKEYFTIESMDDNNTITFLRKRKNTYSYSSFLMDYSVDDGQTWSTVELPSYDGDGDKDPSVTVVTTINSGDKVLFKKNENEKKTDFNLNPIVYTSILASERHIIYGNPMSLVRDNFTEHIRAGARQFIGLFENSSSLVSARNLSFQTIGLGTSGLYTFCGMFRNCTSLVDAPLELPETTLGTLDYQNMFRNCSSLTTAPKISATTVSKETCEYMFSGCTSLTEAPELNITTVGEASLRGMFDGCSNLVRSMTVLPAQDITSNSYRAMFANCTKLETAPRISATTIVGNYSCNYMFQNCSSLVEAPELLASTLREGCYKGMFQGCTSLRYIKCLATDISALACTENWVKDVSSAGTFVKSTSMDLWTTGDSGVPTNWALVNDDSILVTSVTISDSSLTIDKGNSYTLSATVLPNDATDKQVFWSSSDNDVATVDSNGVVSGIGCGDVVITVTTHDGGYTATCDTSVEKHVTDVDLNTYILTINSGGTYQLEATVLPSDACNKSLIWTSSDSSIADVDDNGLVSGVTTGSATIAVVSVDDTSKTKRCSVTVNEGQHVSAVTLNESSISIINGGTYTLVATVLPSDAVNKNVTWSSSDDSIATVDSNGVVSGVSVGDATITVTTVDGGYTAQCSVSVTSAHDYSHDYFTIESLEDGNDVKLQKVNGGPNITIQYSIDDGETWNNVTNTTAGATIAVIDNGGKILLKGNYDAYASDWNKYNHFIGSKQFKVYGNVMSLINGSGFTSNFEFNSSSTNHLVGLFYGSTNLIDASNLILPAQTLYKNSYNGMFRDATNLQHGPQMLATTPTGTECCASMFENCINLEEAIEINFTTLSQQCCQRMFSMSRTTKLTTPKMTKSPILRCETAATDCYKEMLQGNGNLNEITCLLTSSTGGTSDWVKNAGASNGTFYKSPSKNDWPTGNGGIPSGWTVVDYVEE